VAAGWARRLVRRAGGVAGLARGVAPLTFVMHSFMDAAAVAEAWALTGQGRTATDPALRAVQKRLAACAYTMAHPDTDELVPACVQHGVVDPQENVALVTLLPRRPVSAQPASGQPGSAQPGGAKNSRAMLSGSRNDRPEP